jgi:hypothetical protein
MTWKQTEINCGGVAISRRRSLYLDCHLRTWHSFFVGCVLSRSIVFQIQFSSRPIPDVRNISCRRIQPTIENKKELSVLLAWNAKKTEKSEVVYNILREYSGIHCKNNF